MTHPEVFLPEYIYETFFVPELQLQNADFVCTGPRCVSPNDCYTERASLSDLIFEIRSKFDTDVSEHSYYHIPMNTLMSNVTAEDGSTNCLLLVAPSNETEIVKLGTAFF